MNTEPNIVITRSSIRLERKRDEAICCILFAFFSLISQITIAQQQDFQGVIALGFEKKISPSFSLAFLNEERFNQNLSEMAYSYFDGGINYKVDYHWTLGANYRYIFVRDLNNDYLGRNVIYGDVTYSKRIRKFSFSIRGRMQTSFYPLVLNDTKQNSLTYNRDRLTVRYKYSYYVVPFLYTEIFVPIDHPTHKYMDRIRFGTGFNYNFNDRMKAEVYYQIARELNQSNKKTNYAVGIGMYYRM